MSSCLNFCLNIEGNSPCKKLVEEGLLGVGIFTIHTRHNSKQAKKMCWRLVWLRADRRLSLWHVCDKCQHSGTVVISCLPKIWIFWQPTLKFIYFKILIRLQKVVVIKRANKCFTQCGTSVTNANTVAQGWMHATGMSRLPNALIPFWQLVFDQKHIFPCKLTSMWTILCSSWQTHISTAQQVCDKKC